MRVRPGRPSPPSTRLPSTGLGDRDERRVPHGPTGPPAGPYGPRSPGRVPRATYERAAHQTPDRARAEADHRHSPRTPSPEQADRTHARPQTGRPRPRTSRPAKHPADTRRGHPPHMPTGQSRPAGPDTTRTRLHKAPHRHTPKAAADAATAHPHPAHRPEQTNRTRRDPCVAPTGTPGPRAGSRASRSARSADARRGRPPAQPTHAPPGAGRPDPRDARGPPSAPAGHPADTRQSHPRRSPETAPTRHTTHPHHIRRPEQANWSRHEPCAAPSGTPGPGPGPGPPGPSEAPQTRAAAVTWRDPCATSRSTPAPAPVRVSCWVASSRPWGRMPVGCGRQARAGTPVRAVTTGSRAWCISSPTERKNVRGAP